MASVGDEELFELVPRHGPVGAVQRIVERDRDLVDLDDELRAGGPELFVSPGESDDLGPFRNRPLDGVKPRLDEGRLEAVFLGEEGQARESRVGGFPVFSGRLDLGPDVLGREVPPEGAEGHGQGARPGHLLGRHRRGAMG